MSDCSENILTQDLGCGVSCTGLYADKENSDITLYSDKALFNEIHGLLDLTRNGIILSSSFHILIFFSVAGEIQDIYIKEKVKGHIANYSKTKTFPSMSSVIWPTLHSTSGTIVSI